MLALVSVQRSVTSPSSERVGQVDLHPIGSLVEQIVTLWHPLEIWLFGSRARGEAVADSDWDLLVVVPDDLAEDQLDPLIAWRLQKGAGVRAEIVPCRATDFAEDRSTPNTLAYEAATRGLRVYER